ncbi:hypothetical protein ABKN59_008209 [Abortiporus biennis]
MLGGRKDSKAPVLSFSENVSFLRTSIILQTVLHEARAVENRNVISRSSWLPRTLWRGFVTLSDRESRQRTNMVFPTRIITPVDNFWEPDHF